MTNQKHYRVQTVRSERAIEREGLDPDQVEEVIGDFFTLAEAVEVFQTTKSGTEIDKQIVFTSENVTIVMEIDPD